MRRQTAPGSSKKPGGGGQRGVLTPSPPLPLLGTRQGLLSQEVRTLPPAFWVHVRSFKFGRFAAGEKSWSHPICAPPSGNIRRCAIAPEDTKSTSRMGSIGACPGACLRGSSTSEGTFPSGSLRGGRSLLSSSEGLLTTLLYSTLLSLLYSTLLYSTLLYSTLLYSTLLYSTPLHTSDSTPLYFTPLYSTVLHLVLDSTLTGDPVLGDAPPGGTLQVALEVGRRRSGIIIVHPDQTQSFVPNSSSDQTRTTL
jgi:hypothetical protein